MKQKFVGYVSYWYKNQDNVEDGIKDVQFSVSRASLLLFKPCLAIFGKAVNAACVEKIIKGIPNSETSLVSEWTTDGLTPSFIFDDGDGWEVSYK